MIDRDQVMAEIDPPGGIRNPIAADAFLAKAVRSGVLTPPRRATSGPQPKPEPVTTPGELLDDLDKGRSDW